MKKLRKIIPFLLTVILFLVGCEAALPTVAPTSGLDQDEWYYSEEDVAAYLVEFGELPSNYVTKDEAKDWGWIASEGNLWEVADGYVIGGDYFGNFEGLLPEEPGRDYYEADVNYDGGHRNGERIVFSNDGLIYYTEDHYDSFELLYGEE